MKGYTIQHSIELLEKKQSEGSGGSTTAENVSYDNTGSGLTADNVQEAIDIIATKKPVKYSSTERVIGKVGESDLYEVTLSKSSINIVGNSSIDITSDLASLGIDTIYGAELVLSYEYTSGDVTTSYRSLGLAPVNLLKSGNTYELKLSIGGATLDSLTIDYTIQYTKTAASEAKTTRKKSSK